MLTIAFPVHVRMESCHLLIILEWETLPGRLPVLRVYVVEGVGPVISLGTFKPRQILHIGA
ncbi:hypothetical protein PSCFBP2116_02093 [Pseudomonas syringae]|uniref:Uncharacterized protein n=1 Tax=Pseudomonas syringae TaxID=317 RepID=A0A2K4WX66_PSESX|nr:hypothetical protein CFBP3840_03451 [Pseudomonas syringae]SPD81614.1 hypothetical protein PSCFBP2116_02093 [Pseudomonas syringae]